MWSWKSWENPWVFQLRHLSFWFDVGNRIDLQAYTKLEKADVLEVTVKFLNDFLAARQVGVSPPGYNICHSSPPQHHEIPHLFNQVSNPSFALQQYELSTCEQAFQSNQRLHPTASSNLDSRTPLSRKRSFNSLQEGGQVSADDSPPKIVRLQDDDSSSELCEFDNKVWRPFWAFVTKIKILITFCNYGFGS